MPHAADRRSRRDHTPLRRRQLPVLLDRLRQPVREQSRGVRVTVDVLVIGAGAAGLGVARQADACGATTRVLECGERAGASWWHRYDGLRLNTVRWLSDLPPQRMAAEHGRWPGRKAWARYLVDYAEQLPDVRYGVRADRVERAGTRWRVRTSAGDMMAGNVVVASGHDRVPTTPAWPGRQGYRGRVMHSADFTSAQSLAGARVLVVGTGNSGVEIATLAAHSDADEVAISVRTPPLLLRREIAGVPITVLAELGRLVPDRLLDWYGRRLHRWLWPDADRYGMGEPGRRLSEMRATYYSPPLDSGFTDAVRTGRIEIVGALSGFDGDDVVLGDGDRREVDVVIAATGFHPGLEDLVGHLGVLDADGEPKAVAGEQDQRSPGLFFAGFRYGLFALLPYLEGDAEAIANAICRSRKPAAATLRRALKIGVLRP
ncbi:NAD(P)/FAD-dependent oxidoreductase [Mycolicibacterium moriokaense]|nr:NAD(P)/FAD-dependent oxidoreductase [Mycolicibacterium moriokaense]